MSDRLRNGLIITAMIVMAAALALMISTEPASFDRTQAIGAQIKCPVCQGESIADSPAPMARDMMALVAERVDQGATDDQIIDELLASYSGALLLDPPASGQTLVLWLAPLAALAIGVLVIVWWNRHPGSEKVTETPTPARSRGRLVVGGLILVAVFAGIIAVASNSLQGGDPTSAGVAALEDEDFNNVSNETMEAVVAANADHPQINGMRLALAERYYEANDYRSAFPHYLAVAESSASDSELLTSLVRLGWMAYDGNGEKVTAIQLLDEALEIDPDSQTALYLKGQVLWCGNSDFATAEVLFGRILKDPDLPGDSRSQVETDLAAVQAGSKCG
jgi:cytochrome c-type biogenesis protein CcmH